MKMNTYLFFDGRCEEAFAFYAKLFGGKIEMMLVHEGTPAEGHVPAEWRKKILHARLVIGDNILMASDAPPDHSQKPQGFYVNIGLTDVPEGERLFNALADGGTVRMPFEKTFWAERFGMLVDRFGTPWMINCEASA